MKKIYALILLTAGFLLSGCSDILDISPKNKIPAEQLFSTEEGIRSHMANLYGRLPIEDFNYSPNKNFNIGVDGDVNNSGFMPAHYCDEALHPEYNDFGEEAFNYWDAGYPLIRDINSFLAIIPKLTVISEQKKEAIMGEAYFLRAYTYYALVKRYGGVPIIKEPQGFEGDIEGLKVPRNTEKQTWDFILEDCDNAYAGLESQTSTQKADPRIANQYTTLALKSRVALHAASVAKYTHAPYVTFSGPAVDAELIVIPASEADNYYKICMEACRQLMNSGAFALSNPQPESVERAGENYRKLFQDPSQYLSGVREPIFIKSYVKGTILTHNYDIWFRPRQVQSVRHPGRMNPTLDFVDTYEDYTDDGTGKSVPVKTRVDGEEDNYNGFDPQAEYITYPMNTPYKAFENKDARLHGTVLLPGENWGSTKIIIQGGLVNPDGTFHYRTQASSVGLDGKTYYTYGAAEPLDYSGFDPALGNYTRSGFLFKKFMQIDNEIEQEFQKGTQDWIEFRYAEILLNYAEAVVECTTSTAAEKTVAGKALNDIRHRAAHTDNIPLTVENVRKERFIELAFENKRRWDLIRWRVFHTEFENRIRKGLVPFLDLRHNPPCYIFVRVNPLGIEAKTFLYNWYYKKIPGIESNGLIQNP